MRALSLIIVLALSVMMTACASNQTEYDTSVIIMRHGESEANAKHIIASNPLGLGKTIGLTNMGRAQVRKAAIKIEGLIETRRHVGVVIVSSPFLRAVETADILSDQLGDAVPRIISTRFQERFFGVFEGLSTDNYEKIWAMDRDGKAPRRDWNVETLEAIHARTQPELDQLRLDYPGYAIVIVTHGDVASVMIAADKGVPLARHREVGGLPTAGIAVLRP